MKIEPVSGDPLPFRATPFANIAVIGAGSWGTALSATSARAGVQVRLWGRKSTVINEINRDHTNSAYLSDVLLPESLLGVRNMKDALRDAEAAMIVVPSRSVRNIARQMKEYIRPGIPVAVCAKGIEDETGYLMSQIVEEELPGHPVGVVSGPTFARETALNHPTAATVAFPFGYRDRLKPEDSAAVRFAVSLTTESFRAHISDDLIGVEIGGAVKNVVAIACGMMTGAGFAENTRAALITRGLDEMKALAEALGGRRETVTGLSGIGDLSLTCSSTTSRNMSLGIALGEGRTLQDVLAERTTVAEGVHTADAALDLAHRHGVAMPITEAVAEIVSERLSVDEAIRALLNRPFTTED